MNTAVAGSIHDPHATVNGPANESPVAAISWAAIICGALAILVSSIVLVALGTGFNLMSISPWPNSGVSATTFTITGAIGLIVVQWASAGLGGYLTGRLRTRWAGVHTHEVFFRDTAHGFMAWALATLMGMVLLTSAAAFVASAGVDAAGQVAGAAAQGATQGAVQSASGLSDYDIDTMFRSDRPDATANADATVQATRILVAGLANGQVPAEDRTYLARMIAARTGISQADAEKRVDAAIARGKAALDKARQAADAARKAASMLAIFTGLSMLIGAFIASAAAAWGGSLRDDHYEANRLA